MDRLQQWRRDLGGGSGAPGAADPAEPRGRRPHRVVRPIAWSSDGTKLLILRRKPVPISGGSPFEELSVLETDGTETRLTDTDTT